MTRWLLACVILLGFGILRTPLEIRIDKEKQTAGFSRPSPSKELREQLGQSGFLAALGGFRSMLAAVLWIDAHAAWERTEWGRMAALFQAVTTLQPRSPLYWDMASWHMAWNAGSAAYQNPDQPSEALRLRAQKQYWDLGKDFLQRGILNNPNEFSLYERLAILERDKYQDFCAAAKNFDAAASLPGAPEYLKRFALYSLALCPGKEKEAYEKLRSLADETDSRLLPGILHHLQQLEEKLGIPKEKRVNSQKKNPGN